MILTCPSCGTQYVVKDGAIPPGGRQVRCAACKHSWHQDPEGDDAFQGAAEPEIDEAPQGFADAEPGQVPEDESYPAQVETEQGETEQGEDESFAEATMIEPRSGPEAEERAYEEAIVESDAPLAGEEVAAEAVEPSETPVYAKKPFDLRPTEESAPPQSDWREPPEGEAQDDGFTPFPAADEQEPRRRSPLIAILTVVLAVVVIAAAFWFLAPPEWKAKLGLAHVGGTQLALVTEHMDRQRLESGNELLTVTGRVINQSGKEQEVPPLQAQLKTSNGDIVYSWTIAPPARSLAPGASASFNSAEVNVPPGGDELTITVGGEPS